MSTGQENNPISRRFREERERLGFSRPELASALHVTLGTVKNWEGGSSSPNADGLAIFQDIGADVMYILTGRKASGNAVAQGTADYAVTPAKQLAAKVGTMILTATDADLLLDFAKRLSQHK